MYMKRVLLFHRQPVEISKELRALKNSGYRVEVVDVSPKALRSMRENPPAAVIIDLTHAPSGGRDVGIYIRHYRTTRHVPIVFTGCKPEKVVEIRKHVPDALYTKWSTVRSALKRVITHPPVDPVAPDSLLAGYSGTPLVKKLGIKPNTTVTLVDAPSYFSELLAVLPDGAKLRRRFGKNNDLIIWCVRSNEVLKNRVDDISGHVGDAGLWIVWPKKGSRIPSDLSQKSVREAGLSAGLVDYKVCAIDRTWAGLKFSVRKRD
jgi:CheY-like chemotaxis protein